MTPLNYTHLQELGFTLLIPIIQDKAEQDEAATMWAKEMNERVIRLELHTKLNGTANDGSDADKEKAPFYPEGLKLYTGEKNSPGLQYETTVFYVEELHAFIAQVDETSS